MTFDEIPMRMLQLDVDRSWLATQCDYKPGTLAAILAPKGNKGHKTDKALRRIWEALDREEERQRVENEKKNMPTIMPVMHQLVLRPSDTEFNSWNEASRNQQLNVTDWCIDTLNTAAKAWKRNKINFKDIAKSESSKVAEEEMEYPQKKM